MPFHVGDRLKHPKKPDWGLGEVMASDGEYVTVLFVDAGEKKLSLNHAVLQLVTAEDAVSPQLDQMLIEPAKLKLTKYKIGRRPRTRASHNVRTWGILESHLSHTGSASYEQLVSLAKDHDHPSGGSGFVDYAIANGWLVKETQEPSFASKTPDHSAAENLDVRAIRDQEKRSTVSAVVKRTDDTEGLLQDYIHGFFGYGSLSAPLWFIGMEEGTGKETLEERLHAWQDLGRTATLDIRLFHERIHEKRWFSESPTIQSTWRRLIILVLRYVGEPVDRERIRHYQASRLARENEVLLELMPLPHKSLGEWDHQSLFASRDDYLSAIAPRRLAELQQAIVSHGPKAVVMYGKTPPYPQYWQTIAGGSLTSMAQGWSYRLSGQVLYVACHHPVAHGISDDYFTSIGDFLRESQSRQK